MRRFVDLSTPPQENAAALRMTIKEWWFREQPSLQWFRMSTKNPGLAALERKVDELGLRQEVEEELAQILIEHKIAELAQNAAG